MGKPQERIDSDWIDLKLVLDRNHGNVMATARETGIPRATIQSRIRAQADPFPIVPGKSVLYDAQTGNEKLVWATGKGMGALTLEEATAKVREALEDYKPPTPLKTAPAAPKKDLLAFYPLPDYHVSLRCWGDEVGKDWDIAIAGKVLRQAHTELVAGMPETEHAIVLGMGDLVHADNYSQMTASRATSHVLDVDGRYPKALHAATTLVIDIVNLALSKAKFVTLRIMRGNHDEHAALAVSLALQMHFAPNKRVTVDTNPGLHWCYRHGKVLLAASHGHKVKPAQLPLFIAAEHSEDWGKSEWRFCFAGHVHHETRKEFPGCVVETLAAPVPLDSYAHEMGFSNSPSIQAMVYDKNKGKKLTMKVNI